MPTDTLPSIEGAELIAEPLTNDPRVRRRYFAFLQKWRNWLRQQIGRSQTGNKDLADGGVDDLLAITLLVQFVRDRSLDAIQSLDQLPRCQGGFTLGQLCTDLQKTATCSVLKAVFDPARFANQCVLPTSVMERAFWRPIIEASRRLYGSRLPVAIFGDLHQWCLAFSPDESPVAKRGARSETRRYDKGIHYTPAALVNYLTSRVLAQALDGLALLLLQKSSARGAGRHVWVRGKGSLREKLSALTTQSPNAFVEIRPLPPQVIRSDRWFFQSAAESDLLAKIQAIGKPLSRLPIHIGQGVVTGADHVFLSRKVDESNDGSILVEQRNTGLRFAIEAPMLRPIIRNRDIDGYAVPSPATLCLVPYDSTGRLLNEVALCRDFPRAHQYLLANKNQLATGNRKRLEAWYAFTSTAALRVAASTKVIGGLITSGGDMTIVPGSDLCHGGVLSMTPDAKVIDPYYLLAICNSSIFWAFVKHKMPTMGIGRHTIRLERLRQFPLVVPGSENQALVKAVAAAVRGLMADAPSSLERKKIMANNDRLVRQLYGLEE